MDALDRQYINQLQSRLRNFKVFSKGIRFSCPFCLDSTTDKKKARGYILTKKNKTYFYCHNNSGCNKSFNNFLKQIDPELYKQYRLDKFKDSIKSRTVSQPERTPRTLKSIPCDTEVGLQSISSLSKTHPARLYIKSRKIPEVFWTDIYYCPKWWKFVSEKCNECIDKNIKEHDRIVFPLRDSKGNMFGFQGRSISNIKPKYITKKIKDDELKIFGQERIKENKQVFILEGPIDSLFVENAIAITGSAIDLINCPYRNNRIFILDREQRNQEIIKQYYKLIKAGEKIVSWKDCPWKGKDINDILLKNKCTIQDINNYLKTHIISGLKAKLEVDSWKRI